MYIQPITFNLYNNRPQNYKQRIYLNTSRDVFVRQTAPSFEGSLFESICNKYITSWTLKRSRNASRKIFQTVEEPLKGQIKEIDIPIDKDTDIKLWDINPKNKDKYILFLHGFSQNITNNLTLYKEMIKTDFGLLALEYRGYGKTKPQNNSKEEHFTKDIKVAIDYLKEKGVKEVGVVGHSFGGYLASKISKSEDFSFQVLVSPITSLEFWLKKVSKNPKRYSKEFLLINKFSAFREQYFEIFNISKYIKDNDTPTYVITSKNDSYSVSKNLQEEFNNSPKLVDFIALDDGGHRFDEKKVFAVRDLLFGLSK